MEIHIEVTGWLGLVRFVAFTLTYFATPFVAFGLGRTSYDDDEEA